MLDDTTRRVEAAVRELVRERGIDPATETRAFQDLVREVIQLDEERSLRGIVPPIADPDGLHKAVAAAVAGLGALQPLLEDPEVEEIWRAHPRLPSAGLSGHSLRQPRDGSLTGANSGECGGCGLFL